ncbi:transmembrane GTPase Marf isoform X3 [Cryptotermes secundus]|uniref:transmembrane GTPase Marf isoform X3 n=1 Tax=Cryptotermes secundus TaxID=105785 RepID=UPI000CD7DE20|nr:transmembrane GTPase Marf isoform X3 [Cryptotermes secundus]
MAAYINRTVSLMSGDDPVGRGTSMAVGPMGDGQSLHDSSSLQIFIKAKKKINDIFVEIEDYVLDSVTYVQSLQRERSIVNSDDAAKVESYIAKAKGIRDVLTRNHMKVAFFGRTSNGKSTVINAMLHDKILPSGIGHTTHCFLQVEGSESGESYLVTEDSTEKQNVKSIGQLAHALCKEKLGENQLVHIYWPKDKCVLLRDDVVFVDSPGIDVSPNLDEWIDRYCQDADVFVLVANAESTLMLTEKNFFHKVSTRLSKPNIFILNNRWDASATEPEFLDQHRNEQNEVRAQHMERAVDFLVKELKVCTQKEAHERIFFVSAREALQARLQEQKGLPAHSGGLADGFHNRYFEFQDFERKFEDCISKSAVRTKFQQHSQQGKLIVADVRTVMDRTYDRAQQLRTEKAESKKELHEKLNFTEQQLLLLTQEMKDKIRQMVEDVEQKVSKALSEEIRRLAVLVDEFSLPFHPEQLVLNGYKKELHVYVENGMGSNLRSRLSAALAMNIENSQREMTERMSVLLPADKKQVSLNVLSRREPFEILYRLNCENLCADFHEDLEFRFSWGLTSIISRFAGKKADSLALTNYTQRIPRDLLSPSDSLDVTHLKLPSNSTEDWTSIASRIAMASIGSQGTVGGLLVAGFMLKTVGWRVILVTGAIYGCIYLYERLTWTNKAKERQFKQQYINHTTKKLRQIVDLTSANCSHQVQQELSSTFARLCHLVDGATNDMDAEIKTLAKEIRQLEEAASSSKLLRNKANYITKELEIFDDVYFKLQN